MHKVREKNSKKLKKALVGANDYVFKNVQAPPPVVLINIGDDDPARGDTKGRIGLGNIVAKKLKTKALYADETLLSALYPDMDDKAYNAKLEKFLRDQRCYPDVVFGSRCGGALMALGRNIDDVVTYTDFNENLSSEYLDEDELVSHHITKKSLEIAGREFRTYHNDLSKPIITIFIAEQYDGALERFTYHLGKILSSHEDSTIYICGGRRNDLDLQRQTENLFREKIKELQIEDRFDVISWEFNRDGYNPYMGLIACSDHFIVWGASQSLVSEPLVRGKTVHIYDNWQNYSNLASQGYVAQFMHSDSLQTIQQKPLNLTDSLSDVLIQDIEEKRSRTVKNISQDLVNDNTPPSWQQILVDIRFRPESIKKMRGNLRWNRTFLQKALMTNPLCAKFFNSEAVLNYDIALEMVKKNAAGFAALPDTYKSDVHFIRSCKDHLEEIFPMIDERLKGDRAFVFECLEIDPEIFRFLNESLRDDEELVRHACSFCENVTGVFSICSDRLKDYDPFVRDIMQKSPGSFYYISSRLRSDPYYIKLALSHSAHNYRYLSDEDQGNRDYIKLMLQESFCDFYLVKDLPLLRDEDFAIEILDFYKTGKEDHLYELKYLLEPFEGNSKVMLKALELSRDFMNIASPELLNDLDFLLEAKELCGDIVSYYGSEITASEEAMTLLAHDSNDPAKNICSAFTNATHHTDMGEVFANDNEQKSPPACDPVLNYPSL